MREALVSFKGINGGIYICIKKGNFNVIKDELKKKLEESVDFFKGGNILGVKGEDLTQEQTNEILNIIENKFQLNVLNYDLPECLDKKMVFPGIHEGMTKFINNTIRSGQVVEYDGNIVIIGDVNPGALIKAKGNIIVLGSLKGVAHAGIDGNCEAVVAAYDLQPTQLRISNIISRRPDGIMVSSGLPEVARVSNGEVIIEPYLPRKY